MRFLVLMLLVFNVLEIDCMEEYLFNKATYNINNDANKSQYYLNVLLFSEAYFQIKEAIDSSSSINQAITKSYEIITEFLLLSKIFYLMYSSEIKDILDELMIHSKFKLHAFMQIRYLFERNQLRKIYLAKFDGKILKRKLALKKIELKLLTLEKRISKMENLSLVRFHIRNEKNNYSDTDLSQKYLDSLNLNSQSKSS